MTTQHSETEAIAVIGMAGRFPGASTLSDFWKNLRDGVESIHRFTEEELRAAGETEERLRDGAYVRALPRLEGIADFDAAFFGMSARDASVFDPQHRFFLECAWEAFEHAGYVGERVTGPVAVFASCGLCEYMIKNVLTNPDVCASMGEWLIRHTGNDTNFLATRVSYELDLRGPSLNVQTACSSSLVAIHLACQSLLSGECDVALAGGSTISVDQDRGYLYREGEILSPDGHCRAFDKDAAGTLVSSATACVVLKRLSQALYDGDHIMAVVRGSAINNDGNDKVGYLAPSVSGQARVVAEALAVAGVDARDVSYVEAHGTATLIGDPIELAGLTQAFRQNTQDSQFCAIGSLKTNIGHAGEASGAASFIKTVLSLMHRELPPSLHYREPNPQADFPSSPFFVNASLRPWTVALGKTRIAGVTGLGAGGTNAHVILEEAPRPPDASGPSRSSQLLTVSARTRTALETATQRLVAHLKADPSLVLADVSHTLLSGRKAFRHRRAVACASIQEAITALESGDSRWVSTHFHPHSPPSVVFMFPGGGAQYVGMGHDLYASEAAYRSVIDACASFINPRLGVDLRTLLVGDKRESGTGERGLALERPSLGLPALFATEYAVAKLLESWGITPSAMIGHSAGEYVAACLAGVLSMHDALALVSLRGRLFETVPAGAMLSVALPAADLRTRMPAELSIAAINADKLSVASGPVSLVNALQQALEAEEIECTRVRIDVAAHSSMLDPILLELGAFCRTIRFSAPQIPYVSNLTGTWITASQATDPNYWVRHLRETVRFGEGVTTLLHDPNRVLLEVGPGRTLGSLARQASAKAHAIVSSMRHPSEQASDLTVMLGAVGRVWAAGVGIDESKLFAGERRRKVPLPTYPFERQRYWVEPGKPQQAAASTQLHKRANVADWFYTPYWHRAPLAGGLASLGELTWLVVTGGSTLAQRLVDQLRDAGGTIIPVTLGARFVDRGPLGFTVNPAERRDLFAMISALSARGTLPQCIVHAVALDGPAFRNPFRSAEDQELELMGQILEREHSSLTYLVQALASEVERTRLFVLTTGAYAVLEDRPWAPARALLHGVCRVVPRELAHVSSVTIDVDLPRSVQAEARLLDRLVAELRAPIQHDLVAFRQGERWLRRFEPIALEATAPAAWARADGVYLITGGLGGIGLSIADHLARTVRPTLILVSRSTLPPEEEWSCDGWGPDAPEESVAERIRSVQALRALGARVHVASADVTDLRAVRNLVREVTGKYGRITGVLHVAGVLRDALLAQRGPEASSDVIDVKVRGALVLEAALAQDPPDLFVLFSSISSLVGLPGQADYTAANAFLDALAHRNWPSERTRTVAVNWNTWREVGMVAALAREARPSKRPPAGELGGRRPQAAPIPQAGAQAAPLLDTAEQRGESLLFSTQFSRARHWLLSEHVVRDGDALIPGTGFIELARQAAVYGASSPGTVELRDLFFVAPFAVGASEVRALHTHLDLRSGELVFYSDSEAEPHAMVRASCTELAPGSRHDLTEIRTRCAERTVRYDGFLPQPFMDFGPRWGCIRRADYGRGEALLELELPADFASELDAYPCHPSLLDLATGGAQALIPDFEPDHTFYVPFSYSRVLIYRPLPPKVWSHVRHRPGEARDLAVFDITLCDESGEELASFEGFAMRLLGPGSALTPRQAVQPTPGPQPETAIDLALREGILPAEGMDALDRLLSAEVGPQVVVCSVDLYGFIENTDRDARGRTDRPPAGAPQFQRPTLGSEYVAPRTPIERELSQLWGELLGLEQVGTQDDFFELGGQSLVAVRLFARLRKRFGIELPLSTLFDTPTIAGTARMIAERLAVDDAPDEAGVITAPPPAPAHGQDGAPPFKSLVVVQRGTPDRTPFFCVHGAGGNVLNFRDLARAMPRAQAFFGLQARGVDGLLAPHASIEEMAQSYLDEVREVQPHGPYLLGGYSGGGVVALEMAQRLAREGEQVALLVLIDTYHPQMPLRLPTLRDQLRRLREERLSYVRSALEGRLVISRRTEAERAQIASHVRNREPIPAELRDRQLTDNFERAAARYLPLPWSGQTTLLRARSVPELYRDGGEAYGWDKLMPVEVIEVPGDHATLLLEPNATTLVRSLGRVLERVHRTIHTPAKWD